MCVQEPIATVSVKAIMSSGSYYIKYTKFIHAQVTEVKQAEKLKYPPYPLNTIELGKRASRYFRMSSEQTMKVTSDFLARQCSYVSLISLK